MTQQPNYQAIEPTVEPIGDAQGPPLGVLNVISTSSNQHHLSPTTAGPATFGASSSSQSPYSGGVASLGAAFNPSEPRGVIVITGGTGFLGKEIIKNLLLNPVSVIGTFLDATTSSGTGGTGSGSEDEKHGNQTKRVDSAPSVHLSIVAVVRSSRTSIEEFHIPDAEASKRLHLVVMPEITFESLNSLPLHAVTSSNNTPYGSLNNASSANGPAGVYGYGAQPLPLGSTNSVQGLNSSNSTNTTSGSIGSTGYAAGLSPGGGRRRFRRAVSPGMEPLAKLGPLLGIIHCAGLVKHSKRPADVAEMYHANVACSNSVFRYALNKQVRVVYASSSGVVGCQDLNEKGAKPQSDVFGSTVPPSVATVSSWDNSSGKSHASSSGEGIVPSPGVSGSMVQIAPKVTGSALQHNIAAAVPDEDSPYCHKVVSPAFPYYMQKIDVEERWRDRALLAEVDIIFLRPSLLLGPGDERLSGTRLLYDVAAKSVPFMVPGGASFVDVRDAAIAFIGALFAPREQLPAGTVVNLAACNTTTKRLVVETARVAGVPPPRFMLPPICVRLGAKALSFFNTVTRRPYDPSVDPVFAEMGLRFWNINTHSELARRVCHFNPRPIKATIEDTVHYIQRVQMPRRTAAEAATNATQRSRMTCLLRRILTSRFRWLVLVLAAFTVMALYWLMPFYASVSHVQ